MNADTMKKNAQQAADATAASAREELEALKKQLEQFLNHHVVPSLSEAASSAHDVAERQKKNVGTQVCTRPLMSIGISAIVGFVLGRLSR